jgi:septum formation protein
MSAPTVYLAAFGPRREQLLHQLGIRFQPLRLRGGERADPDVSRENVAGESAAEHANRVALAKALGGVRRIALRRLAPGPVLAADTVIEFDGFTLAAPLAEDEAAGLLGRLAGHSHRVLTAVVVADADRAEHLLSSTEVRLGAMSADEIRRYVATGEPLRSVCGYDLRGKGGRFVEEIVGSDSAVAGLPLFQTAMLLRRFGCAT